MGMAIFGAVTALVSVLLGFAMGLAVGKNSSDVGSVTYLPLTPQTYITGDEDGIK